MAVDDLALTIRSENQSCELWGVRRQDLELEDPPIIEHLERPARQASPTFSAFVCQTLLYEAKFGELGCTGLVRESSLREELTQSLSRCDVPEVYWVGTPLRIYEGTDLLVTTESDWVFVAAREEGALTQLSPRILGMLEMYRG